MTASMLRCNMTLNMSRGGALGNRTCHDGRDGRTLMKIRRRAALSLAAAAGCAALVVCQSRAADETAPLMLARDGYFYVNAKTATVAGKTYVTDQMYVEER